MDNNDLLAEIKKFNRNVEWLKKKEINPANKWVKAGIIFKITQWTPAQLLTAKRNRYIAFKGTGKGTVYDPSSINKEYLIATGSPTPGASLQGSFPELHDNNFQGKSLR